jgi:two-component system phosphate regulon sensor histidine kinase PhoR
LHIAYTLHNLLKYLSLITDCIAVFKKSPSKSTLRTLTLLLVLLVLLPAIFYSAYEIGALTQSENLIERIYRQQLDAALFSLNQYAWDVADRWASDVDQIIRAARSSRRPLSRNAFESFLSDNRGIHALFVGDTAATSLVVASSTRLDSTQRKYTENDFKSLILPQHAVVTRLARLQAEGYRKIEGISIPVGPQEQSTCLLFVGEIAPGRLFLSGIVLDAESFVQDVLRRKLDEAAEGEFLLSVVRKADNRQVYATGSLTPGEERQTKDLWLFPDYSLGIRLKGQTIEELVRERFYRNLSLLIILDVTIVIGVWFVYRTVRREIELSQLKSDFVSNVSHELRTPLSLIRMFGETLEMGRVPNEEKKQEYYATIVRETERLTALVNNILNFSRMESGKKEYHLSSVDLNAVVRKVLSSYYSHLEHMGFELKTDIAATLPPILADAEAVPEALLNVMDNAIKYSGAQKSITIRTGAADRMVFVEVEDHGIGIPPAEQSRIFEKFYRVSSGLVHETRGSGLGLTLVRHIMDAHKGEISVRSRLGEGSTFRLSFPVSTSSQNQ